MRKFSVPKRRQIKREVRNLRHFREADFISDLQNMPWHEIELTKDPNLAWKKWESSFNEVLNRHAPLVHKRIRSSLLPWLNSSIKKQIYTRDYHKKQFVKVAPYSYYVIAYSCAQRPIISLFCKI